MLKGSAFGHPNVLTSGNAPSNPGVYSMMLTGHSRLHTMQRQAPEATSVNFAFASWIPAEDDGFQFLNILWLNTKSQPNPIGQARKSTHQHTMSLRQRLKDFRSKHNKESKVKNSRPPKNTNVPPEPTEKPKGTTSSGESEDLWEEAEQRLVKDERTARILNEASQIVEESGLKIGSPGTADHQQLGSFLNTQVKELEDKRWIIHFGDHFIRVRDQLTRIFKNIIVLKDVINTAASSSPPVAVACASVTVSLLVKLSAEAFCYLITH